MSYVCDWSIELPVIVGGRVVGYCPDVDCVLALDERGRLLVAEYRRADDTVRVVDASLAPPA